MSPGVADPQPALPAAQRPDPRRPRRGPRHRHRRPRAAAHHHRLDHPRGRLHEHPAAHPGQPGGLRRRTGTPPRPSPASSSRSAPTRRSCSASELWRETRIAAVRAGHRHPQRGAQGAGRAPAGVVRRAVDHLDLRPVRGERPLLPGAAADHSTTRTRSRCSRPAARRRWPSCGCTTARSTAGTGPVYDVVDGVPHLRVENRVLPAGPTVADTMANAAFYFGLVRTLAEHERPLWSQMSFSAAEENFHVGARARHRGPGLLARPRSGAGHRAGACAGCCRWREPVWTRWGVEPDERDRLLGIIEQRCVVGPERRLLVRRPVPPPGSPTRRRPARRAARDAAGVPRADAHQRARCTPGTEPHAAVRAAAAPRPGSRR